MNKATRAAPYGRGLSGINSPIAHEFPRDGIVGRLLIGAAVLAVSCVLSTLGGVIWLAAGILPSLFGLFVIAGNLRALLDPNWRRIVLDHDGVEIRYGFSRRYFRFLDYSDYHISRRGGRSILVALPVEIRCVEGERVERPRVTIHDRPAFITPTPLFGGGAPASVLEWQSLLNCLRHAALASNGLGGEIRPQSTATMAEVGWRGYQFVARVLPRL